MKLIDLTGIIHDGQQGHMQTVIKDLRIIDQATMNDPSIQRTFAVKSMTLSDHTGTHVDAPAHFIPGGDTIEAMPVDAFYGEAVVADFSEETGTGEELTVEAFERLMKQSRKAVQSGDIVLFRLNAPDGRPVYSGLSKLLSEHLVKNRVKLVGTDQGSIDWSANKPRPAHVILLGAGIPIVEGLCRLGEVSDTRFTFCGFPLNIRSATGSPIRAVAMIHRTGAPH